MVKVPVTFSTLSGDASGGDAGYLFALLVNTDTNGVMELEVDSNTGTYGYDFANVPYGNYLLVAKVSIYP